MRFQYQITHIPGSDLKIAYALSWAPLLEITQTDKQLQQDADAYVAQVVQGLPATPEKLLEICQAQEQDHVYQQLPYSRFLMRELYSCVSRNSQH